MTKKNFLLCIIFCFLFIITGCKNKSGEEEKTFFNKEIFSINFNNDARFVIEDENGKFGYIDKTGKIVISPQFSYAEPFQEGVAAIQIEKERKYYYGLIDNSGKSILEPEYDEVRAFSEELAAVVSEGKTGYVNKKGKFVIWPKFDYGYNFNNGLAKVVEGGKVGFINKKGEYVIYPKYKNAHTKGFKNNKAIVMSDGKYCLINKEGEIVKTFDFDYVLDFTNDLYAIQNKDYKFGLADTSGKTVLEIKYGYLDSLDKEGNLISFGSDKFLYGVFDKNYKEIIPPKYKSSAFYGEEIILFADENNKTSYLYDTKGKLLKTAKAVVSGEFSSGLALIEDENGKYGYMNKQANTAIFPKYSYAETFKNGLAYVREATKEKEIEGYIDTKGNYVWKRENKLEIEKEETYVYKEPTVSNNSSKVSSNGGNYKKPQQKTTPSYYYKPAKSEDIREAESNILN